MSESTVKHNTPTNLRSATQCIEHVKENETCKSHCGVSWGDYIITHLEKIM